MQVRSVMVEQTLFQQTDFFLSILNSIDQEIAVIDERGLILFVNESWRRFGAENESNTKNWLGLNYLDVCTNAKGMSENGVEEILAGFNAVFNGEKDRFEYEYPCNSPAENRWFMMSLCKLNQLPAKLFVTIHTNITERKHMEEMVSTLSLRDDLTGLSNRRHFERFLDSEWRRNLRDQTQITLLMLDIDFFKQFNDRFGHLTGDRCLKKVASIIREFSHRSSDLAVRWGGEEFILVMGNMPNELAMDIAENIRILVQNSIDPEYGQCTISVGVATIVPHGADWNCLIKMADDTLYQAKKMGRNRVISDVQGL